VKKLAVISLLTILLIGQWGYYVFYAVQLYKAKKEAFIKTLQTIPETLLTKIDIDDNADKIKWEDDGKELKLHGQMYDVVAVKIESGRKVALCINDEKETEVLKELSNVSAKHNDLNSSDKTKAPLTSKITVPIQDWIFDGFLLSGDYTPEKIISKYYNYSQALQKRFIEVNSPPPNFYI
jgi:phosphotransferase system HPr-like phosphotransfer protein